jgi:hypothetical protein
MSIFSQSLTYGNSRNTYYYRIDHQGLSPALLRLSDSPANAGGA